MRNPPRPAKIYRSTCRKLSACVTVFAAFTLCLLTPMPRAARAQSAATSDIVISQIYTRGGLPGATFQNDFVELFNRGNATVNIAGWGLSISSSEGNASESGTTAIFSTRSFGVNIAPGRHMLIGLGGGNVFGGGGGAGQTLPTPDLDLTSTPLQLLGDRGQVALLRSTQNIQPGQCLANDTTGTVADFVAYGNSTCVEGSGPAPAPDVASAALRRGGGCSDNNDDAFDFNLAAPTPRSTTDAATPCNAPTLSSFFDFSAPQFDTAEGRGHATISVTRLGDTSTPASVEYDVSGGIAPNATDRGDYTTAVGTLRFAPGETSKTFDVLITDDGVQEPNENAFMALLNAKGAGIGPRNSAVLVIHDNDFTPAATNPVDGSNFYARQHYADFLGREPDASGLSFWTQNVESCGADAVCRDVKRVDTSAAFFLSIEFQETGYLVYRLYRASLPATSSRPRAMPRYREFVRDTHDVGQGVVVGADGWQQKLEANTLVFLDDFVSRAEFTSNYPLQLTPAEYVDKLNAQAGGSLSKDERDALVSEMIAGLETRASVLRRIADAPAFRAAEFNRAFVLMQYFGYLRRNPDDAPDTNFAGYDFWLSKLDQFGGDFRRAEMVKAFISSSEYRDRFDAPAQ
jgi:hypothetical protein